MPVYEYACNKCGHEFETVQRITDEPQAKCPRCKGKAKRLISRSGFILKGTGWYVTDYARKGNGNGERAKAKEAPSAAESKPAKPADPPAKPSPAPAGE